MKTITMDVSNKTYSHVNIDPGEPVRVDITCKGIPIVGVMSFTGPIAEITGIPASVRDLTLANTEKLHLDSLPDKLKDLSMFTETTTVKTLPKDLEVLRVVDSLGLVNLEQVPNLRSLIYTGRAIEIDDIPVGIEFLFCTFKSEYTDIKLLSNLKKLVLHKTQGFTLEIGDSVTALRLDECRYKSIGYLGNSLEELVITNTLIHDGVLTLPEGLRVFAMDNVRAAYEVPLDVPPIPDSLKYLNGDSVAKRKLKT